MHAARHIHNAHTYKFSSDEKSLFQLCVNDLLFSFYLNRMICQHHSSTALSFISLFSRFVLWLLLLWCFPHQFFVSLFLHSRNKSPFQVSLDARQTQFPNSIILFNVSCLALAGSLFANMRTFSTFYSHLFILCVRLSLKANHIQI